MSVFIENYCKANKNDFASRLNQLHDKAVIIGSDELEFLDDDGVVTARIYIAHSISCNDIEVLQSLFGGCYWRFLPSFRGSGYALWIDLKDNML